VISRIFLVVMCVITLIGVPRSRGGRLTSQPVFWVLTGTVLYSSGSFVVFGLSNVLLREGLAYFHIAWHINWLLLIAANLLYTKGLLCKSQE
jgi:hypothetical protein